MPVPAVVGYVAAGVVAGLLAIIQHGPPQGFVPGVCERLEPYLASQMVGQELALQQLADAVCDHVGSANPAKPLVLSAHGPPGVGKSLAHLLMARALYNPDAGPDMQCPGMDCPGYKVLYGMDYVAGEQERQLALLRGSLLGHLGGHPEALVVVEEYDKLDCPTRGFLRQLLEGARTGNASAHRAIFVLESNSGYLELLQLLEAAGDRSKVSPETAQRVLKDLMFSAWQRRSGGRGGADSAGGGDVEEEEEEEGMCREGRADTLKMLALVDFYLPFLPLERRHIERLFDMRLTERKEALLVAPTPANLSWDVDVLKFLTDRVDFDGEYPIEGAKEVGTLMTRYVSRALRAWSAPQAALALAALGAKKSPLKLVSSKVHGLVMLLQKERPKGEGADLAAVAAAELPAALPGVRLSVGRDRAGNLHLVAQTRE